MKNTNTKQTATKLLKKQVESKMDNKEYYHCYGFNDDMEYFFAMVNQSTDQEREEEYRYMESKERGCYE